MVDPSVIGSIGGSASSIGYVGLFVTRLYRSFGSSGLGFHRHIICCSFFAANFCVDDGCFLLFRDFNCSNIDFMNSGSLL